MISYSDFETAKWAQCTSSIECQKELLFGTDWLFETDPELWMRLRTCTDSEWPELVQKVFGLMDRYERLCAFL